MYRSDLIKVTVKILKRFFLSSCLFPILQWVLIVVTAENTGLVINMIPFVNQTNHLRIQKSTSLCCQLIIPYASLTNALS